MTGADLAKRFAVEGSKGSRFMPVSLQKIN